VWQAKLLSHVSTSKVGCYQITLGVESVRKESPLGQLVRVSAEASSGEESFLFLLALELEVFFHCFTWHMKRDVITTLEFKVSRRMK